MNSHRKENRYASIAACIREIRRQAGLNQSDLAARLGLKQNTISKWEKAKSRPDARHLVKLMGIGHQLESLPLTSFLAEELGLSEAAIICLLGVDQGNDLLDLIAAEHAKLLAFGSELTARRQALEEEEKRLEKKESELWRRLK